MEIRVDDLSAPAVFQLLREHLQGMALHGEIKSMRTASSQLRKSVAALLIRLSLETGSAEAFAPAHRL